jgi:hypothetical protein
MLLWFGWSGECVEGAGVEGVVQGKMKQQVDDPRTLTMRDADSLRSSEVDLALDRFALAFNTECLLLCWDVLRCGKMCAWLKIVV